MHGPALERDFFKQMAAAIAEEVEKIRQRKRRLLSLEEAAEYYGLSVESMRELIVQGRVKPIRLTRKVQFDIVALDKVIDAEAEA